ncbi:unnamed protein product [Bemisia tabaci]|uniref:Uncharacterized protein n=1 Tax=Bemisia tabaci TaxID=7038 RepID=A0A9P0EWB6_BEMTA|nr:unnamed protein product [Bemisia tabaci]
MAMQNISPFIAASDTLEGASSNNARVKQEPPDEAEIRELAAKISEANKAKMAQAQANQNARAANAANLANGQGIASYFPKVTPQNKLAATQPTAAVEAPVTPAKKTENVPIDESSRKGQFGWTTLGKADLPYILRNGEKYIAVQMVETKLLDVYLNYLHRDIYSCTSIPSYYVTEIESKLLREINERHCDFYYGKEMFTVKDLVVKYEDAKEFYTFLDFCYHKLTNKQNPNSAVKDKCGFIRINGESVVPFTVKDDQKFVPLFYFEGETDNLKLKSEKLENWDLAYLKFCCKVQGIRNELFASETCSVISLTNIKSYFPTGTTFEAYWPTKVVDSQLIVSTQRPNSMAGSGSSWIKAPPGGVPVIPSAVTSVMQRMPSGQQVPMNGWNAQAAAPAYQAAQVTRMAQPVIHQQIGGTVVTPNDRNFVTAPVRPAARTHQANQYYLSHQQAANPTLTRVVGSTVSGNATYVTSNQQYAMQYAMQGIPKSVANANASQLVSNAKYPPPLIPVNGAAQPSGGGGTNMSSQRFANHPNPNVRTNPEIIDLSSPQQSPLPAQRNVYSKANGAATGNGHIANRVSDSNQYKKLIPISEFQQENNSHFPYKLQKVYVNGQMVQAINAKPYVSDEQLITLQDLIAAFFPSVPVNKLREVLQDVLKVNLFRGNALQHHVLRENNKCKPNEIVPLVQLGDILTYMPQLNYMFASRQASIEEPTSKRQRTS